ncbi:MAG: 5'-3' exonuclease, partial [Propionibacterium sp.]|nr:5'-3' exonuclease [Propionibacterium sp.]
MNPPFLQLYDTASLYFRAFFGLPTSLKAPDGQPVNAVRGLLDFMARFISEYRPTHAAACWDNSWRPAWRVELVPSYKAHRVLAGELEVVPDELSPQVPLILAVLDALGIVVVGADGYEADDVIGTLASTASVPVDVVTGDRDLFQLVDDAREIRVLSVVKGVRNHERVTDEVLRVRYGITGAGYADFATLRGDASDGLPGVAGIGEKTA